VLTAGAILWAFVDWAGAVLDTVRISTTRAVGSRIRALLITILLGRSNPDLHPLGVPEALLLLIAGLRAVALAQAILILISVLGYRHTGGHRDCEHQAYCHHCLPEHDRTSFSNVAVRSTSLDRATMKRAASRS
jgi:hypothetical protein